MKKEEKFALLTASVIHYLREGPHRHSWMSSRKGMTSFYTHVHLNPYTEEGRARFVEEHENAEWEDAASEVGGTVSGRFEASKPNSLNMQNLLVSDCDVHPDGC